MPQSLQGSVPGVCCTTPAPTAKLSSSDIAKTNTCGTEVQPTVLIGTPVPGGAANSTTNPVVFLTRSGFSWPAIGQNVSIPVDDSSPFASGIWLYFSARGYLKISDIPGTQMLTLTNLGITGSAVENTNVPRNTPYLMVGEPKPDIAEATLAGLVTQKVAEELPDAIAAQTDGVPHWEASLMLSATQGRLPVITFDEASGKRRLRYIAPVENGDGQLLAASVLNAQGDLTPRLHRPNSSQYGELGGYVNKDPLSDASPQISAKVAPIDLSASLGDAAASFRLLGWSASSLSGNVFRKAWYGLKKFILPATFVEATDLVNDSVELVVLQKVDSDKSHHFKRLAPVNGKMLVGANDKWTLQTIGSVFIPNTGGYPALHSSGTTYGSKAAGENYVATDLAPSIPSGVSATHVWLHVRLKFTCDGSLNPQFASDSHRSSVAVYLDNLKVCEAASIQENSGNQANTGTDSAMILVKLNEGNQVPFKISRETVFDAGSEDTDRVDCVVTQLGFVGTFV